MKFLSKIISLAPTAYRVTERRPLYTILAGSLLIILREAALFYKLHLVIIAIVFRIGLSLATNRAAHPLITLLAGNELTLFLRFHLVVLGITLRVAVGTLAGEAFLHLMTAAVNAALVSTVAV